MFIVLWLFFNHLLKFQLVLDKILEQNLVSVVEETNWYSSKTQSKTGRSTQVAGKSCQYWVKCHCRQSRGSQCQHPCSRAEVCIFAGLLHVF